MATHYSVLAWKIPLTEEPVRLQSIGWQRAKREKGRNSSEVTASQCQAGPRSTKGMGSSPGTCPKTLEGPHLESPKWGGGRMATKPRARPQGWGVGW